MIIERTFDSYIIHNRDTIFSALNKIVQTKGRILFVVDDRGILKGLFSNGDIFRWLSRNSMPDLNQPVTAIVNTNYKFVKESDGLNKINKYLEDVLFVPIVDDYNRLVAVARRRKIGEGISIGDVTISKESPTFIIAEIGNNHNGSLPLAKKLINQAHRAGADCVKFQMRDMSTLYRGVKGRNHDETENLGTEYTVDLLNSFQLATNEMYEAFDYCYEKGIIPLCTPWDSNSVRKLEDYGMLAYKVASADLTNHDLLEMLGKTGKPLLCSTGMSTEHEIREAIQLLRYLGSPYILLHCNSTYPAPFKDINLRYLEQLQKIGDCLVGYSGHERGGNVAIAAVALGAKVIEKHFTLDREMEGNDHKVSLMQDEFGAMVEGIRHVEEALGCADERQLTQGEMINRVSLAKSLVCTCDLNPGDIIQPAMIDVKSPGQGLQPNKKQELIGARINRKMFKGDFFYPSDLATKVIDARSYKFDRPWGIPVRFHDYKELLNKSNPGLLEFHLSYKDMEIEINKCFDRAYDMDFIVHSPELFSGDHILDLCSSDAAYRAKSVRELQKVVNLTRSLKSYFKKANTPLIITNIGGFSFNAPLRELESKSLYHQLLESLDQLDTSGVEIIPQTMPPFPWHFGGQRFHNLFVNPWEIDHFCKNHHYRICLDVSHSALACNQFHWSFMQFVEILGPHIAHLHIADAEGKDGEGLQIGSGHIDFPALADNLKLNAPQASFIPEIWQGHENGGEGFWVALDKLENYF